MALAATAVLVNRSRSNNLPAILAQMGRCKSIKKVLIWNNAPAFSHHDLALRQYASHPCHCWPPIEVVGCGRNLLTLGRYQAIEQAGATDVVVTCDDDWLVCNWDKILATWESHKRQVVACLQPPHYETDCKRRWRINDLHNCHEILVGCGAAFAPHLVQEAFIRYHAKHEHDFLLCREADRIFTIMSMREHHPIRALGQSLPSNGDENAVDLQADHEVCVVEVRRRCLAALDAKQWAFNGIGY